MELFDNLFSEFFCCILFIIVFNASFPISIEFLAKLLNILTDFSNKFSLIFFFVIKLFRLCFEYSFNEYPLLIILFILSKLSPILSSSIFLLII